MLAAARTYLARGWSVIPIRPSTKAAAVPWKPYQERRATDDEIQAWWPPSGGNGIAIVTGSVSGNLAVLDIDEVGLAERLASDPVLLAQAIAARTPSGGLHLYIVETQTKSASGPLVPGVADLKVNGGYVLAPPTAGYHWIHDGVGDEPS